MKLEEKNITFPEDMDKECIELCELLNTLPTVKTFESCCGHGKHPYWIFFRCDSIPALTRLGRCVNCNYSDGNWEILVDSTDSSPYGNFWLRSKIIFANETDMKNSVNGLIKNIHYWFQDKFDEYFSKR